MTVVRDMKKQTGFTLVELIVAMAVVAIMSMFAAPAMRAFIQNSKAVTQTNQLVTALNYSRSEAVKRRTRVVICALNSSQNACSTSSVPWDSNGWMVFADRDSDGVYDAGDGDSDLEDGEDVLLKQWKEISNKDDIDITAGATSFTYLQSGSMSGSSTVGMQVGATDSNTADRCVRVARTGRVAYEKMTNGVTCP